MLYKRCYDATEAREGGVCFFVCCCQESSHVLSLAEGRSQIRCGKKWEVTDAEQTQTLVTKRWGVGFAGLFGPPPIGVSCGPRRIGSPQLCWGGPAKSSCEAVFQRLASFGPPPRSESLVKFCSQKLW